MLNFTQLRVLYEVIRLSSMTKAAQSLHISQPAVSNSLKKFQEDFGIRLVKKSGRGLRITNAGRTLYAMLQKIFILEKEIEEYIHTMQDKKAGRVRIGIATVYARYMAADIINAFAQKHPQVTVVLETGTSLQLEKKILEGELDLALAANVLADKKLVYAPLIEEKLELVCSKNNPAKMQQISITQLNDLPFIMKSRHSGSRNAVDIFFQQHGITPTILAELESLDAIQELMESGTGFAFFPATALKKKHQMLTVIPIQDVSLSFTSSIVSAGTEEMSPLHTSFVQVLKQLIAENKTV